MQTDQENLPTAAAAAADSLQTVESKEDVPALGVTQVCFVMLPTKYSESVSLSDDGPPRSDVQYNSECCYPSRRSFRTAAEFVPRMKPKFHTSVLRVDGEPDGTVVYHERVELAYCMLMREFSEAVYNFPYETKNIFATTVTYFPNCVERRYITSLEMEPGLMVSMRAPKDELPAAGCNGDEARFRAEVQLHLPAVLVNGSP